MPSEPDSQIERLLKAYAQQRREAAEPPLELHPATRNLFQAEVARTYPKRALGNSSSQSFWALLWPRLAWGGALFVVLLVVTLILVPWPQKSTSQIELASQANRAFSPDQWNEPTPPAPAAPTPLTVAQSDRAPDRPEIPAHKPLPETQAAPSPSQRLKGVPRESATSAGKTQLTSSRPAANFSDSGRSQTSVALSASLAEAKSPSLPVPEPGAYAFARRLTGAVSQSPPQSIRLCFAIASELKSFSDKDLELGRTPSSVSQPTAMFGIRHQVMNTFDLELTGDRVQIIDSDGSIYSGQVVTQGVSRLAKAAPTKPLAPAIQIKTTGGEISRQTGAAAPTVSPGISGTPEFHFRVAGTNRSLNQPLVINGQLLRVAETPMPADGLSLALPSSSPILRSNALARKVQAPHPTLRFLGQAVIGQTNRLEINAVPVKR